MQLNQKGLALLIMKTLLLALLATASSAKADGYPIDPKTGSQVAELKSPAEIPRYVYHWTKPESLLKRAAELKGSQVWPGFPPLNSPTMIFMRAWPQFRNSPKGGMFVWTHPVTAVMGSEHERYGEVLLRLEIDRRKARAVALTIGQGFNPNDASAYTGQLNPSKYNLVYHNARRFQEWIILDPTLIKSVTADPEDLRPLLEAELAHLKDPSFSYAPKDIHYSKFETPQPGQNIFREPSQRGYAIYRLSRYLRDGRKIVPSAFLSQRRPFRHLSATSNRKAIRLFKVHDYDVYVRETRDYVLSDDDFFLVNDHERLKEILAVRLLREATARDTRGKQLESLSEFEKSRATLREALATFINEKSVPQTEVKRYLSRALDLRVHTTTVVAEIIRRYHLRAEYHALEKSVPMLKRLRLRSN